MKIVADQNIYRVSDYFSGYGELLLLPGRDIQKRDVANADVLLVRTITRVDEALLAGSSVRFVGSATSGADHIDHDFLEANNIHCYSAQGCNADAVVNYVLTALANLFEQTGENFLEKSVGIIGAGNIGGRLACVLNSLGMRVSIYDPFLSNDHPLSPYFVSLQDVMKQQIITLHVPLTMDGHFPTQGMLNEELLSSMESGAILINAARGEVIDNQLLVSIMNKRRDVRLVLDVWENEPGIEPLLLQRANLATPHIAGYTLNGKWNATKMIADHFYTEFSVRQTQSSTDTTFGTIELEHSGNLCVTLSRAMLAAYNISKDEIPRELYKTPEKLAVSFDSRRSNYLFRPEFSDFHVTAAGLGDSETRALKILGFNVHCV